MRTRCGLLAVSVLAGWAFAPGAEGAESDRCAGDARRVRLHVEGDRRIVGCLVMDGESLLLRPDRNGGILPLTPPDVRRMDVWAGRHDRTLLILSSAAAGAGLGYGLGAVADFIDGLDSFMCESHCPPGSQNRFRGAAAGLALGAILGATTGRDRWLEIRRDDWHVTLAPTAAQRGLGAALTFRF